MAEADQQQQHEEGQEQEPQERTYSFEEQRAMQHGWTPKDQWEGPEEDWISAKQFNERGDLFGRIAKDKKELTELRGVVSELVQTNRKNYDEGFKAGLAQLRAERKAAIEEGDAQKAFDIEDKIDELKEEHAQKRQQFEEKIAQQKQPENPVFDAWHANNQWYLQDGTATTYANEIMQETMQQARLTGTQVEYPKVLQEIARKVRQKFPEKFGRVKGDSPPGPVESGRRGENKDTESEGSTKGMTEQERSIMRNIMKATGMSQKEYLAEQHKFVQRKGG